MATNELENPTMHGPQIGRRRRFSSAEKRRFLDESNLPGETMSSVGRRYGLSVSLLFRWRRQLAAPEQLSQPVQAPARAMADQSDVKRLSAEVVELRRLVAEKNAEVEELRRALNRHVEPHVAAAAGQSGSPRLVRDGRA